MNATFAILRPHRGAVKQRGLPGRYLKARPTSKTRDCGIPCPTCGSTHSAVHDSRASSENGQCRRRRVCLKCETRFTTYEMRAVEPALDYQI